MVKRQLNNAGVLKGLSPETHRVIHSLISGRRHGIEKHKETLSSKEGKGALMRAMRHKRGSVREAALDTLLEIDEKTATRVARAALGDKSPAVRISAGQILGKNIGDVKGGHLQTLLFNPSLLNRANAMSEYAKRHGYSNALKLVKKRFPDSRSTYVPKYLSYKGKIGQTPMHKTDKPEDEGTHAFIHRGLPVRLVPSKMLEGKEIDAMGEYRDGAIWLNADESVLPKRFRKAIAEHEFGEIWVHEQGLALQLKKLDEDGLVGDFWGHIKDKPFELTRERQLQNLIEQYPNDFGHLKKDLDM